MCEGMGEVNDVRAVEIVKNGKVVKQGNFHRWGGTFCIVGVGKRAPMPVTGGIVEFEDGSVEMFPPDEIRFMVPRSLGPNVKPMTGA